MSEREARITEAAAGTGFRLRRLFGREELSRTYAFHVLVESSSATLDLGRLLGTKLGVEVDAHQGAKQHHHGFVMDAVLAGRDLDKTLYELTVVPWLWFLDCGADIRIFQDATVPEIVEQVFAGYPIADFVPLQPSRTYRTRTYTVQYRESDYAFVARLLEDEGIFYFFRHEATRHKLLLVDHVAALKAQPGYERVPFFAADQPGRRERDHVDRWQARARVRPGRTSLHDYDFEQPTTDLTAKAENVASHPFGAGEVYDYPGGYTELAHGDERAQTLLEAHQMRDRRGFGTGNAPGLRCGATFELTGGPSGTAGVTWVIVAADFTIEVEGSRSGASAGGEPYRGVVEVEDARQPFRPDRITARPFVHGPQTAVVTGPEGEEIYTDKHGRVKVQFHWDRQGKKDQGSSCWLRVSQYWAGAKWGSIHVPRIGQEVLVDFLEGDPDRPLVTGRLYNAHRLPPYDLPANASQSGWKSSSLGKGGGFNEIRFEDKAGKEDLYMHAQRTHTVVVLASESRSIGGALSTTIGKNDTYVLKDGDRKDTVEKGSELLTISMGDQKTTVKMGSETHDVTLGDFKVAAPVGTVHLKAMTVKIEGTTTVTLTCGASSISLNPAMIELKAPLIKIN